MTNIERAVEIIFAAEKRIQGHTYDLDGAKVWVYMKALDRAGILMPDLPEPDKDSSTGTSVWWENGTLGVTVYPGGEIGMMIEWDEEARYTAATARAQALALLAAANRAEVTHVGGADS